MPIDNIVKGSLGVAFVLTCTQNDSAVDISTFTTLKTVIIESPDTTKHTLTAAFDSDGSDGKITATSSTGTSTFDQSGKYKLRAHIQSSAQDIYSMAVSFDVEDRI